MTYNLENMKRIIKIALERLLERDCFLVQNDVNERSITHKLAEYLQQQFPAYHVDCEYNRMISQVYKNDIKEYVTKKLNFIIEQVNIDDTNGKTVYPDIIVHQRGTNDNNLLVIELKKDSSNTSKEFDCAKLRLFTEASLNYKFGFYIELNSKGRTKIITFKDGNEVS